MGYELKIPLKVGTLEVEFDTVAQLERRLERLDVARIERAVLAALGGPRGGKRSRTKGAKKKARARKGR